MVEHYVPVQQEKLISDAAKATELISEDGLERFAELQKQYNEAMDYGDFYKASDIAEEMRGIK